MYYCSKATYSSFFPVPSQAIKKIPSRNNGCGIRSVSFKGNILTIGTGIGVMLFWDLRAGKFLESTMNSNRAVSIKSSKGWMVSKKYVSLPIQLFYIKKPKYFLFPQLRDDHYLQNIEGGLNAHKNQPAIYTHCYDESGTR